MGSLLTAFIAAKVPRETEGVFYLRIEDTDKKREVEDGVTGYEKSLEYYKAAYDTKNYSLSYKEIRKEWIGNFIILIPIGNLILMVLLLKDSEKNDNKYGEYPVL